VVIVAARREGQWLAMLVVPPADIDITGIAVEVRIGADEGLPADGVLRVALPRPGHINCAWLVTVTPTDLLARAGRLTPAKLDEVDELVRVGGLDIAVAGLVTTPGDIADSFEFGS
jgi:mRNA interferase MazF